MFERYTERARRVLFFARYEASEFGADSIHTEHLLLGIIRDGKGLAIRVLQQAQVSPERIRQEVGRRVAVQERIPTSREIPFSGETKRALQYAVEEADRLKLAYIGPEHLLLALLRDQHTVAGSILASLGMDYGAVRRDFADLLKQGPEASPPGMVTVTLEPQIDAIKQLVDQLAQLAAGTPEALALVQRIRQMLDDLKPPSGQWLTFM
jgi:ATP-dependent Clp protease ATP-binding subunit ClpC